MKSIFLLEKKRICKNIIVHVMSYKEAASKFKCKFKSPEGEWSKGAYFHKTNEIFIHKYLPSYTKTWVLLHEEGHYLCDFKECRCLESYSFFDIRRIILKECHAYKYALSECVKKGYIKSKDDMLSSIKEHRFCKEIMKGLVKKK